MLDNKMRLVILGRRQSGLERQMPGAQVFDWREVCNLYKSEKALKILESGESDTRGKMENAILLLTPAETALKIEGIEGVLPTRKSRYVVSGYIPEGYFTYSTYGSTGDSDPEYVAIRTDEPGIEKAVRQIRKANGSKICCGVELNVKKASSFIRTYRANAKESTIREILSLPVEEQRKRLESLL